jgi:hypothetical protein
LVCSQGNLLFKDALVIVSFKWQDSSQDIVQNNTTSPNISCLAAVLLLGKNLWSHERRGAAEKFEFFFARNCKPKVN